jgi:hypothetical protein
MLKMKMAITLGIVGVRFHHDLTNPAKVNVPFCTG